MNKLFSFMENKYCSECGSRHIGNVEKNGKKEADFCEECGTVIDENLFR